MKIINSLTSEVQIFIGVPISYNNMNLKIFNDLVNKDYKLEEIREHTESDENTDWLNSYNKISFDVKKQNIQLYWPDIADKNILGYIGHKLNIEELFETFVEDIGDHTTKVCNFLIKHKIDGFANVYLSIPSGE